MKKATLILVLTAALAAFSGCGQETILGPGDLDATVSGADLEGDGGEGGGGGDTDASSSRKRTNPKFPYDVRLP